MTFRIRAWAPYRRFPHRVKPAFEEQVARFIAERPITGVEMELDAELRLLVAASAAVLSAAWSGYGWTQVAEVLVYPDQFDRDFVIGSPDLAGVADPWGTIVMSAPALRHSFEDETDGYHVGLHEFAHLLQDRASPYGVPRNLRTDEIRAWDLVQRRDMEAARIGESPLDSYGGSSLREFFPVAVEAFFERPRAVRERHADLYRFLSGYFGQDPAAWADRG